MHILIVGNFLSSVTGTRSVCEDLAERLALAGWDVLTTSNEPHRLRRLYEMLSTVWRSRSIYSVAQVDVYSGLAFLWAELVCWMLRRARKPYILTLHGGNLPAFARRWPWRVRCLLRSAAAVTTPSRYLLEQMQSYRKDLALLANPLDLSAYTFQMRNHLQPRLVWLRAFHTTYNPSLAAHVVALLAQEIPNVHLTMIGPDKADGSLAALQEVAGEHDIAEHITVLGKIAKADVASWLNKGDIFLNTTTVDNTPVSVLEAMACGLCVVSTNVGGIPYLLNDGHDALLVPSDTPLAMAKAVRRILTEPGLASQLSRNARRKVEHFDWTVILPQWEMLLHRVAKG